MNVKEKLKEIALITDKHLERYWDEEIEKNFGFNQKQKDLVKKMLLHAKDHNVRSAKRLRAAFVYYGYLLGNKEINEEIFKAAMGVELVHTALLMHDDVMDEDDLRRGEVTTHKYFEDGDKHTGESMAICLGDTVMSLGYELLLKADLNRNLVNRAAIQLLRGIANTAFGQSYDVTLEKMTDWNEDDVVALHQAKTALYTYENPLLIGAILADLSDEVKKILSEYSMLGGVAFQLQDDILGIFGESEKTGKSNNSDLIHGKRTLLILKTLEMGNEEQKEAILKVWGKKNNDEELVKAAKEAVVESGSLEYSRKISKEYASKAVEMAKKLRGFNLNNEAIDFIEGVAQYMVEREV